MSTPTGRTGRSAVAAHGRSLGRAALALAAATAVLAATGPAAAQEGPADRDTVQAPADSAEAEEAPTEYRREVFDYPGTGRRNPFEPVDGGVEEGPRFENLRVTGVIHSPAIGSVAVLFDMTTGERYRVRDGQTIGEARVLEIRPTEVRFAVSGAGETRRETLQVETRERESEG